MTVLRVMGPGVRSTVQDAGRFGHLRSAVPPAGPADPLAFEAAQRLVGNTAGDAAIEIVGGPFRFTIDAPRLIATTGCDVHVRTLATIDGWTTVFVRAGEEVRVEGTARTRFAYLAVSGGITTAAVLGSRATYLPASIGAPGRPLRAGDLLPVGDPRRDAGSAGRVAARPVASGVRVVRGPHADRIGHAEAFLHGGTYRVSERSDRMGVRLVGATLATDGTEVLSLGVLAGAVQVPHGGDPIVLLADHQTTGGYPVLATVIGADVGAVAQAGPGEALSFYEVDRAAAVEALRATRRWLATL